MKDKAKTLNKKQSLILLIPLIGFIGICLMIFQIKKELQNNISNLLLDMNLLPPQWLFWIFVAMLIVPFTIPSLNKKIRISSLIVTLIFISFSFVLFSPYGYPYGRDSQYAYQVAEEIRDSGYYKIDSGTGFARLYSKYPSMYLFNVITSFLFGIPLISSFMFVQSLLRFILIPLLVYLIFRKFFDFDTSILCVFLYFSCFTIINWPHHENFAIIFFFLFLYVYLLNIKKSTIFTKITLFLSAIFVFMSHHFTSYLLLGWSFLFPFSSFIWYTFKKNRISENETRNSIRNGLIIFIIILILFFSWASYSSLSEDIKQGTSFLNAFSESMKSDLESIVIESVHIDNTNLSLKDIKIIQKGIDEEELELILSNLSDLNKKDVTFDKKFEIKNFINNKYNQIINFRAKFPGANFTSYQIVIIILSFLLLLIFLVYGLFNLKKIILNEFLLNNIIFSSLITFISVVLLFTNFEYVPLRIFEFSYIGIIPLIAYSIISLHKKSKFFKFILPIMLIIILLGGLMSLRTTTIRIYYTPEYRILVDNPLFASPSFISSAMWFKSQFNFTNNQLLGDNLVYDTVGAFGNINVRIYDKDLLNEILNNQIKEDSLNRALSRNIGFIATHKFSEYSNYKTRKEDLNNKSELDLIYDNWGVQFFKIKE